MWQCKHAGLELAPPPPGMGGSCLYPSSARGGEMGVPPPKSTLSPINKVPNAWVPPPLPLDEGEGVKGVGGTRRVSGINWGRGGNFCPSLPPSNPPQYKAGAAEGQGGALA